MTCVKVLGLAAVIAGSLGLATAATAAPMPLGSVDGDVLIQQVAGGCGSGWHPSPWGECRPNRRPYWAGGYGGPYGYHPPPPYGYYVGPRRFFY